MEASLIQKKLDQLRQTAVKDEPDYDELLEALLALFELIEAKTAIKFVLEQIWEYVPQFERYYPDQPWARETLVLAGQLMPFDVSSLEFQFYKNENLDDEEDHPIPGILPFVNALEGLYRVPEYYLNRHQQNWQERGIRKITSVYFDLLLAQLWTRWANECPSQYKTYWSGKVENASVDEYNAALMIFQESKERIKIWKELYLLAADQLEQLLARS